MWKKILLEKKKICPLVKVCFSHLDSWGEKEVKDISTWFANVCLEISYSWKQNCIITFVGFILFLHIYGTVIYRDYGNFKNSWEWRNTTIALKWVHNKTFPSSKNLLKPCSLISIVRWACFTCLCFPVSSVENPFMIIWGWCCDVFSLITFICLSFLIFMYLQFVCWNVFFFPNVLYRNVKGTTI